MTKPIHMRSGFRRIIEVISEEACDDITELTHQLAKERGKPAPECPCRDAPNEEWEAFIAVQDNWSVMVYSPIADEIYYKLGEYFKGEIEVPWEFPDEAPQPQPAEQSGNLIHGPWTNGVNQ
jgi:hypothetical protein